jgi:hypothetical protein
MPKPWLNNKPDQVTDWGNLNTISKKTKLKPGSFTYLIEM